MDGVDIRTEVAFSWIDSSLLVLQTENGIQLTLNHGIKAKSALGETIKLEIKFCRHRFA